MKSFKLQFYNLFFLSRPTRGQPWTPTFLKSNSPQYPLGYAPVYASCLPLVPRGGNSACVQRFSCSCPGVKTTRRTTNNTTTLARATTSKSSKEGKTFQPRKNLLTAAHVLFNHESKASNTGSQFYTKLSGKKRGRERERERERERDGTNLKLAFHYQ